MPEIGNSSPHQPVLYHEVIGALQPESPRRYIDATVGAGGHAAGIMETASPYGELLGLDLDPVALELARENLSIYSQRVILRQASYTTMLEQMQSLGWQSVSGVLLDLGLSSMQLDRPDKGFSFREEGPLDMRFDPEQEVTAGDLVNTLSAEELAKILWQYGEERSSRKIAQAIIKHRPIATTTELASLIVSTIGSHNRSHHPATLTFQALRIAVNQELQSVRQVLPDTLKALEPGGRAVIITFHSLEDRLVKQFFQQETRDCICPPRQPVCTCGHKASIKLVEKFIKPSAEEIRNNPRSRSAKLRVAEKL